MVEKYFVISINAKPLFDIERSFINFFYKTLIKFSEQGNLILCTDLNYGNVVKLAKTIGLKKGYIITSCGSSIYSIHEDKCVYSSYIKKSNVFPLVRQVIVNFDSLVLHSQKNLLVYSNDYELTNDVMNNNENTKIISTYDYDIAQKFVRKNNIEYIEIFNTNISEEQYNSNDENVIQIVNNERLIYNRLSKTRIVVTNTSFQMAIDFLLKKSSEESVIYYISLTDIFKNQDLVTNTEVKASETLDNLFRNKTFHLFRKSFLDLIYKNNIINLESE